MITALYTGTTGTKNHILWMDVISNNVANVATIGFKRSRVTFEDLLSQRIRMALKGTGVRGGLNPKEIGLGVRNASIDVIHTQGHFEETGKKTDLAIQGEGFFILKDGVSKTPYYTRAGGFNFDGEGNLVNPANGYLVQGWTAKFDKVKGRYYIDTSLPLTTLKVDFKSILPAKATENVLIKGNLDSETPLAIDPIVITIGVPLRSLSQVRNGDRTSLNLNAPVTSNNNLAGWTVPPDPQSRIVINQYISAPLSTYATIHQLLDEINNSASAGVEIHYDPDLDMFSIYNDIRLKGRPIYLREIDVEKRGFFSSIHIPTGTHNTEIAHKIKFTRVLDPQHPDHNYFRWEVVDPVTEEAIGMVESAAISVMNTGPNGTPRVSSQKFQGLDITRSFGEAGFDLLPTGYQDTTITIYSSSTGRSYTSKRLGEYKSVKEFIDEVNMDLNAGVTLRYDRVGDRFILTNDNPGSSIEVRESIPGSGFLTMAKFQRYEDNTSDRAVLNATTLPARGIIQLDKDGLVIESYHDTDENGNGIFDLASEVPGISDLWGHTTIAPGVGLDYVRLAHGTIRSSHVLTSTQTVINLGSGDVDKSRIVVTVNNVYVDPAFYSFHDNTGPGGVDQIIFNSPPGMDALVEVNYVRIGKSALRPADLFIPNGNERPESITFSPNTWVSNYRGYNPGTIHTMGIVEMVKDGDPKTTIHKTKDKYTHSISQEVFDSVGTPHNLSFSFERLGTNLWLWTVPNPVEKNKLSGYGILVFNWDGGYNRYISKVFQSPSDPDTFDGDNGDDQPGRTLTIGYRGIYFDPPSLGYPEDYDGAPPPQHGARIVMITPNFDGLFQMTHPSDVNIHQDGFGKGVLKEVEFNDMGVLIGYFDNDQQQPLGQLALASFINPAGLDRVAGTMFKQTANSGLPMIGAPGGGKNGIIVPKWLEMSNVQLVEEFIGMIIAERAFQANSRTITTTDRMLGELMRLRG